jgi:hypothetical protein
MTISAILSGLALLSIAFDGYAGAATFLVLAFFLGGHGAQGEREAPYGNEPLPAHRAPFCSPLPPASKC